MTCLYCLDKAHAVDYGNVPLFPYLGTCHCLCHYLCIYPGSILLRAKRDQRSREEVIHALPAQKSSKGAPSPAFIQEP